VSVYGSEQERKDCLKALNGAAGLLRGEFGRRSGLRYAPEIVFHLDTGIERGQRIFELLHSIEDELKPVPVEETTSESREA
jgi:ribosome-binding factor A